MYMARKRVVEDLCIMKNVFSADASSSPSAPIISVTATAVWGGGDGQEYR